MKKSEISTNKLEQYANLCKKEKEIKELKDLLKKQLEEEFGQKEHMEDTPLGIFKMVAYPKWTYSDTLNTMEEDVKMLKVTEQEKGTATKEVSYNLRFNVKKTP